VLLLRAAGGAGIDVSLGALPFEESVVRRATTASFGPEVELRTCSAEDLMVVKQFAWRPLSEVKEQFQMMGTLTRFKQL
jgi:hypothetical protein